ncbi:hypothetical protein JW916_06840 [Candidatus Sumerlaeota bacterium]|nr:hypothetical protein [Candidatus Sumerlaeota bacterium]
MRHAPSIFLFLALLYLLTLGGHLYSPDEEILFRTTESLATRGALDIESLSGFATRTGTDGLEYAQYGVGQPVAAIPFYWLGRGLARVVPAEKWVALRSAMRTDYPPVSPDEPPSELARETACRFAVSSFNLFVTALTGTFLFLLARRLGGSERAAWLAALMWGAGSAAWPHARTFFTEPLATLCLILAFEMLARYFVPSPLSPERNETEEGPEPLACGCLHSCACGREGLGSSTLPLFAGIAAAYACLVRLDSVVLLAPLAPLVVWGDLRTRNGEGAERRLWREAARHAVQRKVYLRLTVFAIPVVVAGGLVLLLNTLHFGSPFASAYSDQPEGIAFSTPILAGLYGFLFSVGKGMFFFSPGLVLGLWGFGPMVRKRPVFGLALLLAVVLFLLFQSAWRNWTGGWCWGPRHIVQIHALLAIPIAMWLADRWTRGRRFVAVWLLGVGAAVQIYGCSQSFIDFYRVYYSDPRPPYARILYDPARTPTIEAFFALLLLRDPETGAQLPRPVAVSPASFPAPINDSIYVVQNSQWLRYAEMWRDLRIHDFFWLHVYSITRNETNNGRFDSD